MKRFFTSACIVLFSLCLVQAKVRFNPWELILYRPDNYGDMNEVKCWLKLEDEDGTDVTYSAVRKASYEWNATPGTGNYYQKTYYLMGGMAMHLNIKPGKYRITVYTPVDRQNLVKTENDGEWTSNVFEYDTENPTKVLFVYPVANDNGFYKGAWVIDYKAPPFYKWTKPIMQPWPVN